MEILNTKSIENNYYTLDFNRLFRGFNIFFCFLLIASYLSYGENKFVNFTTLILGIFLFLQTHIALLLEKKDKDPFVIVYAYIMIFYFLFRICTLFIFSTSHVFDRFIYNVTDTNYALLYIIAANTFLYMGLKSIKLLDEDFSNNMFSFASYENKNFIFILIYILIAILTNFNVFNFTIFINIFFEPRIVILVSLIYLIISKNISRNILVFVVLFIIIQIIINTLNGSRSSLMVIVEQLLLITLVISYKIKVSKIKVYLFVSSIPIFLVILIILYISATNLRTEKIRFENMSNTLIAKEIYKELSYNNLHYYLGHISGRIGFFDFSSEVIAHKKEYKKLFEVETYLKSVVDNVLTPGFDIFNQARISNSMTFIYNNFGPAKKNLVPTYYQSDQLGIHGEMYSLFGYFSIFLFYPIGLCFKFVFKKLKTNNFFVQTTNRVFLIIIFLTFIKSFGIDWLIYDVIVLFIALHIGAFFFRFKKMGIN